MEIAETIRKPFKGYDVFRAGLVTQTLPDDYKKVTQNLCLVKKKKKITSENFRRFYWAISRNPTEPAEAEAGFFLLLGRIDWLGK